MKEKDFSKLMTKAFGKGANINKLTNKIIESKDIGRILAFAKCPNVPMDKIADAVLSLTDNPNIIYQLALMPRCPVEKVLDAFLNNVDKLGIGAAEAIYNFAKHVKHAPVDKLADALCALPNNKYKASYLEAFASLVKGAPVEKLSKEFVSIIDVADVSDIYDFALNIKTAPIQKLASYVAKSGDAKYIHAFARNIEGAPIDVLAQGFKKQGKTGYYDAEKIFDFARFIKAADLSNLEDAMLNTGDAEYCLRFARLYKNTDDLKRYMDKLSKKEIEICKNSYPEQEIEA